MMPIYLLGARTPSVKIPNKPVSVSISGSVGGAALYVNTGAGQHVVRVNPHVVIVPEFTEGLTVGVEPRGAAAFGHDAVVHLTIGAESPDELDPVQVGFDPVNVSGSGATELAAMTPHGGRVEVAVRSAPDAPLSELASMARTGARRSTNGHPPARCDWLSIGVDTSASMRCAFEDGSVGAAIDVIVGVADVAGIGAVAASLIGRRQTPVEAPAAELAKAVSDAAVRWSAGAQWSLLPQTDRAIAVTDSATSGHGLPMVRVAVDGADPIIGATLVAPPDGTSAQQHLAANPALIDELAAALLPVLT
jgi:hypothetical protein